MCLASAQMSFGRLTQMLEMNFEVMQHFLGSLMSLVERVRAMYSDARQLTSTVGRQSLEFGEQRSMSRAAPEGVGPRAPSARSIVVHWVAE